MDLKQRGDLLSCSALPRVKACPGSFILSKGVPDDQSKDATDGDTVHALVSAWANGETEVQYVGDEELFQKAFEMWGHAQKSAHQFFGQDAQLIWKSEKRHWMVDDNLEPILSGQFDLTCTVENYDHILLYDFKSGFMADEVAPAERNEQIEGMADILREETGRTIYASIVRPWAADQLVEMRDADSRSFVQWVYEQEDPFTAGLKTGKHCRYCPAQRAGKCPLKRDQLALVLKTDLTLAMVDLPPENLARILRASKPAEGVIKAAKEEAIRRHQAGEQIPGITFEKGNTKREIGDEAKFSAMMKAEGVDLSAFQKTSLPIGAAYKAWLAKKEKKDNVASKTEFNRVFKEALNFSENAPSIAFDE